MNAKNTIFGIACLACILAAAVMPVSAAPDEPWVWEYEDEWNQYVGFMLEKVPLALERANTIISKLEQQGADVSMIKVHYDRARYYHKQAVTEFEAGQITSQNMGTVTKVKLEMNYILVEMVKVTGINSPLFKGMEHAYNYAFPTFDKFLDTL